MSREAGKYARFELERRFLVERLPRGVASDDGWRITDRYLIDTRLRLRRMERLGGGETIFKLGQKNVPSPPDFSRMTVTNIYLSPAEYDVFAVLAAHELRKRRFRLSHDGRVYTLDVFEGDLTGLILAEVGFEPSAEMELPDWALREVSHDIRFTGGALAAMSPDEAAALMAEL
jgi:CYTH domain-containing protein